MRQVGIEVYPPNLEEQLRDPRIRQVIHEVEEEAHDHTLEQKEGSWAPGETFAPRQLPDDLLHFPIPGLESIFFSKPQEINYDLEVTDFLQQQLGRDLVPDIGSDSTGIVGNLRVPPDVDLATLKDLRDELRRAYPKAKYDLVSPNHVLTAGPIDCGGPGSEPELPTEALKRPQGNAGRGVRVAVLDSGLLRESLLPDWLRDNIHYFDEDIEDDYFDVEGDEKVTRFPRVHGTFVAGIIRQVAPKAVLVIKRVLDQTGFVSEDRLAQKLVEVVNGHPDIINLSLGCKAWTGEWPPALYKAFERLRSARPQIVVVAAGGNDGRPIKFWPAVEEDVLGVGSVNAFATWAHSNFGPPVDVWARGADVHSVFVKGPYRREATKHEVFFEEPVARWSGTSFAAPLVTGMIAAAMTEGDGRGATAAKQHVVRSGRDTRGLRIPVGSHGQHVPLVLKNVVLP
jgi:subtilisin family serine protease